MITLQRRSGDQVISGPLEKVLPDFTAGERWLFVSPHDDDIIIAGGLILQAGLAAGARVNVAITTDGRMGYGTIEDRDDIVAIRRTETSVSFALVDPAIPVRFLDYPDNDLHRHAGRRRVDPVGSERPSDGGRSEAPPDIRGDHTGLQNSFTALLREVRPRRLFLLSPRDYHPDHQIVHREMLISLFHAQGEIWPELGAPIKDIPSLYELAAYCAFTDTPDIAVRGDGGSFDLKLRGIAAYRSQTQIETLVESLRQAGPIEYVRSFPFEFYTPAVYAGLFPDLKV